MRASSLIIALATAPPFAAAAPQVYEGFNYPIGEQPVSSLDWGTGWSGSFSGTWPGVSGPTTVPIVAGSLTHPESPASTGNAVGVHTFSSPAVLTRNIAQPFTTQQTVWMSVILSLTNFPSAATVRLGQTPGALADSPGFVVASTGYYIDPGVGFGQFVQWRFPDPRPILYFLLRMGPAEGSRRPMDLWLNPGSGGLGAPVQSIMGDSIASDRLLIELGPYTSIDEIRIDTNLANVYVPAPSVAATLALAGTALRRRHRAA